MSKKMTLIYSLIIIIIGLGVAVFINFNYANKPAANISLETNKAAEVKNTDRTSDISFERGGKIIFIAKKVGDRVTAGEVLAKIDNADFLVQSAQASSGVSVAQADLASLQNSLKAEKLKLQYLKLSHAKKIQQQQVDLIENNINAQEARILQARDAVANANAQLDKATITAPFDGIITRQSIELGEIVNPNVPIITILAGNNLSQN